jgi:hypothetical protein
MGESPILEEEIRKYNINSVCVLSVARVSEVLQEACEFREELAVFQIDT